MLDISVLADHLILVLEIPHLNIYISEEMMSVNVISFHHMKLHCTLG
jgi:hypothetical protein